MPFGPASVLRCLRLWTAVLTATALASPVLAQNTVPAARGTVERVHVHGPSLVGNLEGDSPARDVFSPARDVFPEHLSFTVSR